MTVLRLSILLVAMGLGQMASAQNVLSLQGNVISEADPTRTLISKPGWLRGLHVLGDDLPARQRPQIEVVMPKAFLGMTVCARITTIAGDYAAMVEYQVPVEMEQRRARLNFETAYRDKIAVISPENSGIALEKGKCIGDTKNTIREYAANFWNETAASATPGQKDVELMLNMNIARADELVVNASHSVAGAAGTQLRNTCTRINSPDALAYNYRCSVFVPPQLQATGTDAQITFSYERVYRGRLSAPRSATIYVGAGP